MFRRWRFGRPWNLQACKPCGTPSPQLSADHVLGRGRERAHQEVAEGRTGVRTAAFPLTDDIVAFCNQIRRAPEIEIRECSAEISHECLDVVTAAARLVQGIL